MEDGPYRTFLRCAASWHTRRSRAPNMPLKSCSVFPAPLTPPLHRLFRTLLVAMSEKHHVRSRHPSFRGNTVPFPSAPSISRQSLGLTPADFESIGYSYPQAYDRLSHDPTAIPFRCEYLALPLVRPVAFVLVLGPNNSALSWRRAKNEGAHVVQDPSHHLLSPVVLQYRYHSLESLLRVTYFLRTLRSRLCRYSHNSKRVAQLLRGNVPEHSRSICLSNGWRRRQGAQFRVPPKSYRPSA
jgi:hypothetical protein